MLDDVTGDVDRKLSLSYHSTIGSKSCPDRGWYDPLLGEVEMVLLTALPALALQLGDPDDLILGIAEEFWSSEAQPEPQIRPAFQRRKGGWEAAAAVERDIRWTVCVNGKARGVYLQKESMTMDGVASRHQRQSRSGRVLRAARFQCLP